jgi:ElaA protein
MNNLQWECCRFQQLSNQKLYALLKLRVNVFVVEQQCAYPELDDKDVHNQTRHLIACNNDTVFAYSRLLPPGLSYPEVSLGRFVVAASIRKQGLGSQLMTKSLHEINELWPSHSIKISAQAHLKDFYEKFDFKQIGEGYFEDGIPHIAMLKQH